MDTMTIDNNLEFSRFSSNQRSSCLLSQHHHNQLVIWLAMLTHQVACDPWLGSLDSTFQTGLDSTF
jgi:hypothetical protein